MKSYFVKQSVETFGPLNANGIKSLITRGKLDREDLIAEKKDGPWYRAGSIKALESLWRLGQSVAMPSVSEQFLTVEQLDSAKLPANQVKRLKSLVEPGVLVQWTSDNVYQFSEPRAVVKFSLDGRFAFFADTGTGVPISQLEAVKNTESQPVRGDANPSRGPIDEIIIGIDLGTTNSVVAVVQGSDFKVIPNPEGGRLTPSVVAYSDSGETHVGEPARRQAVTNPQRTVYSVKRFMGRRFAESTVADKMVPYEVSKSKNGYTQIRIDGRDYTPQEVSAKILRKLKEAAESYLGHKVNKAVITVPAYFNDAQREATKDAVQIAGLVVVRIITGPTAAALAYGLDNKSDERIVVFDLGGGTFDVSVLEVGDVDNGDGPRRVFEVISTSGDTQLGGDDFDEALINYVADQFKKDNGVDLRKDTMALQRLKEACEKAKKELSSVRSTDLSLPFITEDANGPKHLQLRITRARFEELIDDLITRCQWVVERALSDARFSPSDVDEVVLVGGSTRVPKVREMVQSIFSKMPYKGVNPDEVVALGAAIQGSVLAGDRTDVLLLDVTPLTLGIETEGGILTPIVERNTNIPVERTQVFSTAADNQQGVTVKVFQGEREMAADNEMLEEFNVEGIPPAPRGEPQIEVKFDIDQNGILNVSAKDLGTKKDLGTQEDPSTQEAPSTQKNMELS